MSIKNFARVPAVAIALAVSCAATTRDCAAENVPVGNVASVNVFAFGTPPSSARGPIYDKHPVVMNEMLETVPDGALVVNLLDNTQLTMGGSAQLVVDEMIYDPNTKKGSALYKLVSGSFFYVSGLLAEDSIKLETPVATIGIRGTSLSIDVAPNGEVSVGVVSGLVSVTSKSTSATQDVEPGQSVSVSSDGDISGVSQGLTPTADPTIDHTTLSELGRATGQNRGRGSVNSGPGSVNSGSINGGRGSANRGGLRDAFENFSRAVEEVERGHHAAPNENAVADIGPGTEAESGGRGGNEGRGGRGGGRGNSGRGGGGRGGDDNSGSGGGGGDDSGSGGSGGGDDSGGGGSGSGGGDDNSGSGGGGDD